VSLKHFTAPFLFPEYFGNNRWISSFCCNVLSLDREAFALRYGGWHGLCDSCQRCATSSTRFRFHLLSIFFCICLQDFFSSRKKADTFMPDDWALSDDMVVGMLENAEVLTWVRTREGLERYLTRHGKHSVSLLQSESRCSKIKVL
jgi:hypothetical protein